jgi:hypothetical protein
MVPDRPRLREEHDASPFHEGEQLAQEHAGVPHKMDAAARHGIRDFMPDQHRSFFAQLPYLIVGSLDADGQPWASLLTGAPGFIASPDDRHLQIRATPPAADPLYGTLRAGASLGILGIELHTRRRNRANGIVDHISDDGFRLRIEQSFGNCPKYIQARIPTATSDNDVGCRVFPAQRVHHARTLDPEMRRIIRTADTFFIASAHPEAPTAGAATHGVDVSHRGGKPGFVRLDDADDRLTVPDYVGNFFFNTLGNLLLNPRAGLLFIDFDSGDLLYLAVETEIIWDGPELEADDRAQRLLRMRVLAARQVERALPWQWSPPELSPHLARG